MTPSLLVTNYLSTPRHIPKDYIIKDKSQYLARSEHIFAKTSNRSGSNVLARGLNQQKKIFAGRFINNTYTLCVLLLIKYRYQQCQYQGGLSYWNVILIELN
jgi:hypothetical protein